MAEPTLVYDDGCGFCRWWARWLDRRADVRLVGFSSLDDGLRARLPADYERCSHLVTDEAVYSCGASIEEALLRTPAGSRLAGPVGFLRHFSDYNRLRERAYRFVADRRGLFGRVLSRPPPARGEDA